jgi:sugar O-acyltransferase (sialic acid O-acetyltransferase NeuD family)
MRVLVIGAGGGGAQVLDVLSRCAGMQPIGVLDNDPHKQGGTLLEVPILGPVSELECRWRANEFDTVANAIVSDGNYRREVFELATSLQIPAVNVVDPSAIIGAGARIGAGNILRPYAVVSAMASLGDNNYIGEHVCIGHHATIGSHTLFLSGAATAGWITVGDQVNVGLGAVIQGRLKIRSGAQIGHGAIVAQDIP